MPKIWYRKSKKAWYLQIDRSRQKRLGKTRAEAEENYRSWLIEQGGTVCESEQNKLTVSEIAQEFLDHSQRHNNPKTYKFYCYFIVPFVERFGSAVAKDFLPLTFTKWLDEHEGWKGARRSAIVAIKRMLNWAVEQKLLNESPLKGVKKPPKKRRNRIVSPEERELIFNLIADEQFKELVTALIETGCRPSEVIAVSATNVSPDGTLWIFDEHKTDHTEQLRIIYLTPSMQDLTQELVRRYPNGPLFRSTRQAQSELCPWTYNAIRCRFKRLREKAARMRESLPPEEQETFPDLSGVTAYTFRHTYATQALINGLPTAVVAQLLGHRSTRMLEEHYSHLDQAAEVLKKAARQAREESTE